MKTAQSKFVLPAIVLAMFITAFAFSIFYNSTHIAMGSTIVGQDYMSTSTAASNVYGAKTTSGLLKTGSGSFGSFVVTGANTGVINFYDATTTDITQRTGAKATTSILIASIPASMVAGTYVFDVALSTGLYLDLVQGNMPTSTITIRN